MNAVAILLTKNSIHTVVESLPYRGKSLFALAALNVPNQGGNWYYVNINMRNPGIVDYGMQIISEVQLEEFFMFDTPAIPEFWFPVILRYDAWATKN